MRGSAAASADIDDPDELLENGVDPGPGDARDPADRLPAGGLELGRDLLDALLRERVALVERDDLVLGDELRRGARPIRPRLDETGLVRRELAPDDPIGLGGRGGAGLGAARPVDEVEEDAAALDVAEELVAEPDSLVRTLDQPRQVGDHDLLRRVDRRDAEVRAERREGIGADLGPRARDAPEERRLPAFGRPTSPTCARSLSSSV